MSKIARQSLSTMTTQVIMLLFSVATNILIARLLGPAGKGAATLLILIPSTLVNLGNFGIGIANVYFVGKKEDLARIVRNSIFLAAIIGAFLLAISAVLWPYMRHTVFAPVGSAVLVIGIAFTPVMLLQMYLGTVMVGLRDIYFYNVASIARAAVNLAVAVVTIFFLRMGYVGAFLAFAISIAATILMFLYRLKRHHRMSGFIGGLDLQLARRSLAYGIKGFFSNLFNLMNLRVDVFIISYLLSRSISDEATKVAIGCYSIAVAVSEIIWYLATAVSTVLFPTIAGADEERAKQLTPIVSRNVFFLTALAAVAIYATAGIIPLILGAGYRPSIAVIRIILPGIVLFTLPKVLGSDILGRGRPEISAIANGLAMVLNVAANFYLIPIYGINGAAWASVISYGAGAVFITIAYRYISGNGIVETLVVKWSDRLLYRNLLHSLAAGVTSRLKPGG